MEDAVELHKISVARLESIRPERILHEIDINLSQHISAKSDYLNFDSDESSISQKISLLHAWGDALVKAKICGANIDTDVTRWRSEASLAHKQLAPKRGNHENAASAEIWLTTLAQTLKIFAKLDIDEGHSLMFLKYALAESL